MNDRITSAERASLQTLIRQREKVAKADVAEYAAVLMADFEKKLAAVFKPTDHPIWKQAAAAAEAVTSEANERILQVCRDLGIPDAFAPKIHCVWSERGANASKQRRIELRQVARTEVDARVKKAQAAIAKRSVEAQTRIVAAGLTNDAAKALLAEMPTPEQLLPPLDLTAIERLAGPPRLDQMWRYSIFEKDEP
jgi:hypothetical protein